MGGACRSQGDGQCNGVGQATVGTVTNPVPRIEGNQSLLDPERKSSDTAYQGNSTASSQGSKTPPTQSSALLQGISTGRAHQKPGDRGACRWHRTGQPLRHKQHSGWMWKSQGETPSTHTTPKAPRRQELGFTHRYIQMPGT